METKKVNKTADKLYTVSSDLQFISKKKWEEANVNKLKMLESIGIYSKKNDDIFVFNYLIGSLIKKFKKPKSFNEVIIKFKKEFKLRGKEAEDKLQSLFDDLLDKKLLIEAVEVTDQKIKDVESTYYKAGHQIEKYKIIKRLNTHELLQVYLAADEQQNNVIIKLYPIIDSISVEQKTSLQASLYREITILSYFQSNKYINKIISYDKSNNYAILEYIKGDSIRKLAYHKKGGIPYLNSIKIISQLVEFMEYLHRNQYVHGDFHDNNILIDNKLNVKIIDFGLAMHISEEALPNIRKGGIHIFLPPERLQNNVFKYIHKNPSFQSDIYQLGVIMYVLLYNNYPFKDVSWKQKTQNIIENKVSYKKKNASNEKIAVEMIDFLKECLAKQETRIKSGIELAIKWNKIKECV